MIPDPPADSGGNGGPSSGTGPIHSLDEPTPNTGPAVCWEWRVQKCVHGIHAGETPRCGDGETYAANGCCEQDFIGSTTLVNRCNGQVINPYGRSDNYVVTDACDPVGEIGVLPPHRIIIDPALRANFKCQSKIIMDVHNACSDLNDAFLSIFEDLGTHNVTYYNSATISENAITRPDPPSQPLTGPSQIFNFRIELRDDFLNNATDLAIATTVIHENIHALLLYLKYTGNIITMEENPTYEQLLTAYVDKAIQLNSYNGTIPTDNTAHHDFMVQFHNDVAQTVKAYGISKGYNLPDNYYNTLAWAGLHETSVFNFLFPTYINLQLNPAHYTLIQTLAAEQDNYTYQDLQGNDIIPNGTKCLN